MSTLYEALTANDPMLCVTLDCVSCGFHCYGTIHMSNANLNRLICERCNEPTQQVSEVFSVTGKVTERCEPGDVFQAVSKRHELTQISEDVV